MSNKIVKALEDGASKLAKSLGEDAGKAVKDLYRDTGNRLKKVAQNHAENDAKHTSELENILKGGKDEVPREPRGLGGGSRGRAGDGEEPTLGGTSRGGQHSEGNGSCTTGGDPVDVVSGQMIASETDLHLPGQLPLLLRRSYASAYRFGRYFGPGWSSTLDQRVQIDNLGIHYAGDDGETLHYPHPAGSGEPILPEHGARWPLTWNQDSDVIRIEDPGTGRTRHFGAPSAPGGARPIVALTDRNTHGITFTYDSDGVPAEITHSGGYRLAIDTVRTAAGPRIEALRLLDDTNDGRGTTVMSYRYDDLGRLTGVVNASGLTLVYVHDDEDRITSWTDRNGFWYEYEYDADGRVIRGVGSNGALEALFEYDPQDRVTTVTSSLGHRTRYHYDEHGHITATVGPSGDAVLTEYDRYGRLLARTDELGRTTAYTLDAHGDPIRVRRPDGSSLSVQYNGRRLPVEITASDGATWQQTYDERGNRTAVTDPAGAVTRFGYDESGRLTTVTDALGQTTRIRCDSAGLPIEITNPVGAVSRYVRDAFGRVTLITDPLGNTTRLTWTIDGKPLTRTAPDGSTETRTYDAEGNCLTYTDAVGGVTRCEYTHFNQLKSRTGPDGARHTFAHDTELRLVQVTNPQGLTWNYAYDAEGRLASETDFDARLLTYTHDAAGQLIGRLDALGQTIRFAYDELGNLVSRTAEGAETHFEYDAAGRLSRATGSDATVTYRRDRLGRVTAETCDGRTLTFAYDALGRCTTRTTPAGVTTTFTYDAAGNRSALSAAGHVLAFEHDAAGRETARHFGTAVTLASAFDAQGRLTGQHLTADSRPVQHRAYTYRADGSLIAVDDALGGRRAFELDLAGRVTSVQADGWTERYAYDAAGNQTDALWPDVHPGQEAVGPRAYIGTRITRAGRIRYEYDAQGRVTVRQKTRLSRKPDTWTYVWDAEDRLSQVTTPDGTVWRYRYDPLGRRIAKQRLTATGEVAEETLFTWDGATLAEQTTTGGPPPNPVTLTWDHDGIRPLTQTERICAADAPQEVIDERFFAIVSDLVGTPTELVDETGHIAWRTRTTLWGTSAWSRDSTAYTPLRFPGQYFDAESALHYNVHRYYDPGTARYTAPDPLGLSPAPNPVAYVDNPHTTADPLGLACYDVERVPEDELSTLFHYTNEDGHDGIIGSQEMRPSLKEHNPKDARFGDGQYLTNIQPGTKTQGQLSHAFLRVPWAGHKFTHYIEIDVRGLEVMRSVERPDVFVIPNKGNLDLSGRIVSHGKN